MDYRVNVSNPRALVDIVGFHGVERDKLVKSWLEERWEHSQGGILTRELFEAGEGWVDDACPFSLLQKVDEALKAVYEGVPSLVLMRGIGEEHGIADVKGEFRTMLLGYNTKQVVHGLPQFVGMKNKRRKYELISVEKMKLEELPAVIDTDLANRLRANAWREQVRWGGMVWVGRYSVEIPDESVNDRSPLRLDLFDGILEGYDYGRGSFGVAKTTPTSDGNYEFQMLFPIILEKERQKTATSMRYTRTRALVHERVKGRFLEVQRDLQREVESKRSAEKARFEILMGYHHEINNKTRVVLEALGFTITHLKLCGDDKELTEIVEIAYDSAEFILANSKAYFAAEDESCCKPFEVLTYHWKNVDGRRPSSNINFRCDIPPEVEIQMGPASLGVIAEQLYRNFVDYLDEVEDPQVHVVWDDGTIRLRNNGSLFDEATLQRLGRDKVTTRNDHSGVGYLVASKIAEDNSYRLEARNLNEWVEVALLK